MFRNVSKLTEQFHESAPMSKCNDRRRRARGPPGHLWFLFDSDSMDFDSCLTDLREKATAVTHAHAYRRTRLIFLYRPTTPCSYDSSSGSSIYCNPYPGSDLVRHSGLDLGLYSGFALDPGPYSGLALDPGPYSGFALHPGLFRSRSRF
ncbi:hypothetical protein EVAR_80625_1 [Eumeta japonica]|uniref:Uncharacterized protein n=1 Tax=Eumeta variegata TaxID=151549 RepID=A0A4C1YW91_EUMVA|nr:hypothetical protein EVAR_80625_1 [Eumeta japonica]